MGNWTHQVQIDSQNVDVRGTIVVRAEENTAGTAGFEYPSPLGAPFNPSDLRGKPVTIRHNNTLIFTGTVDSAAPTSDGLIKVTASDGLLSFFDGLDEQQVPAALPGARWHPAFFGQRTSGWAQAQAMLETVTYEAHMTASGTLQLSSWMAAVSKTITDAVYLSEAADIADERNQVKRVEITVEYRFDRLKERGGAYSWQLPWYSDLPAWRANPTTLPSRDMIQAAFDGMGWGIHQGIEYVTLPDDIGGWSPTPDQQKTDVIYCVGRIFHRWVQPIEETYTLICQSGSDETPVLKRDVSHETVFDRSQWNNNRVTFETNWQLDNLTDKFLDKADRADLDSLLETAISWGQSRVAESARGNYLQFAVIADAQLTLNDVISIQTPWATAEGKLYALEHRLDTSQGGVDITVITLACATKPAQAGSPPTPPAPPPSIPDWQVGIIPGISQTNIGSIDTAPPDNPDWTGFVGNYDPPRGGTGDQIYRGRFVAGAPTIEQQSLDPFQVSADPVQYAAETPGGFLTFTPAPNTP